MKNFLIVGGLLVAYFLYWCLHFVLIRIMVLTFCIDSTRGRGGYWCLLFVLVRHREEGATSLHAGLERLGKETGEPTGTFGSHPLRTLSSHGNNTDPWRGPLAVLNGRTNDVTILRPPYLCRWLCRTRSLSYWSHADTSPNTSEGGYALTSFRDHTRGHCEIETAHPLGTGSALPYSPISGCGTMDPSDHMVKGGLQRMRPHPHGRHKDDPTNPRGVSSCGLPSAPAREPQKHERNVNGITELVLTFCINSTRA